MPDGTAPNHGRRRVAPLVLSAISLLWLLIAWIMAGMASAGFATRFDQALLEPLLRSIFLLFLVVLGLSALRILSRRTTVVASVLSLPGRPTASREWSLGAAVGWGLVVLAILPGLLAGTWRAQLWFSGRSFALLVVSLLGLLFTTLAIEAVFRGFAMEQMSRFTGPAWAAVILSFLYAMFHAWGGVSTPSGSWTGLLTSGALGLLLATGWLRTHGLWLPWGLHFAWSASMGILFGLPVAGSTALASAVQTRTIGRTALTGGDTGPEGALLTTLLVLLALPLLLRLTRDYAWSYTHSPLIPGGYAVDVPPPAAHAAEASDSHAAPASAPLVQILPSTSRTGSTSPSGE